MALGSKTGVAQLNGAFPIHIAYPISKDQYEENQLLRWPPKSDETLLTEPLWPNVPDETIVRDETQAEDKQDVESDLEAIADSSFKRANKQT